MVSMLSGPIDMKPIRKILAPTDTPFTFGWHFQIFYQQHWCRVLRLSSRLKSIKLSIKRANWKGSSMQHFFPG